MSKPIWAIRIAEERHKIKLTQAELGAKINMSRGRISNYEQGIREPDFETLNKLSLIFGVSTDYLLGNPVTRDHPAVKAWSEEFFERDLVDQAMDRAAHRTFTGEQKAAYDRLLQMSPDEQQRRFYEQFESLPEADREAIKRIIVALAASQK